MMLLNLLKKLISIDSSTKEGANQAIDFCEQWLVHHGLIVKREENNGYKMLVCEIGKGEKTLVLNGHVDVVSGKPELYSPVEKGGRLYGRGAADMKAGVAAMMCAVVELSKKELLSKVQLQIVSDEEIGGFNCSEYLVGHGYRGDFVICGEPTQLGVGLQAKGILQLDIEVLGKSAHGSRPWEGVNAIEKAFQLYGEIRNLPFASESSDFYDYPSINLAKIKGGDVYNKVPDHCVLSLDIRFLPSQTKEEILKQIRNAAEGEVKERMSGEPVRTERDHSFIAALSHMIKKYTDNEALIFGQHGSADTRFFSAFDIPAIEFGPSGANWHGSEEYVIIESVKQYQQILIEFAMEFHK